jgi:hypothetical protein
MFGRYNNSAMSIQPDCKVQISPDVLFQEVAGEIVLLDLRSESYFGLDEVGTRIWRLLETGINIGEVLQKLLQEYDVDQITLEADVADLLERLLEAGLISYSDET